MYCPYCNKYFDNEYVVCPDCGNLLEEENVDKFSNKYDEPVEIFEENRKNVYYDTIPKDRSALYLVLSIVQIFFCNIITGIFALIFTLMGNNNYKNKEYAKAIKNWQSAKISLILGLVLSVLAIAFFIGSVIWILSFLT